LLEHYAGKFPVWLSPVQVKILPISDKFGDYAKSVLQELKKADIRAEIDDRSEKIGKKIRDTELMRVPYMLVVGEKEVNENKVSIRRQGKGDSGSKPVSEFVKEILEEIRERRAE
jgi:threonyl-tRNA synthetase